MLETLRLIYPEDARRLLYKSVPWLEKQWCHRLRAREAKAIAMSPDATAPATTATPAAGARLARVGPRATDVYLWCVLLGDTALGFEVLEHCLEPMRAALLGAHLCNEMARLLPIFQSELVESGRKHEAWAIELLCAPITLAHA